MDKKIYNTMEHFVESQIIDYIIKRDGIDKMVITELFAFNLTDKTKPIIDMFDKLKLKKTEFHELSDYMKNDYNENVLPKFKIRQDTKDETLTLKLKHIENSNEFYNPSCLFISDNYKCFVTKLVYDFFKEIVKPNDNSNLQFKIGNGDTVIYQEKDELIVLPTSDGDIYGEIYPSKKYINGE